VVRIPLHKQFYHSGERDVILLNSLIHGDKGLLSRSGTHSLLTRWSETD